MLLSPKGRDINVYWAFAMLFCDKDTNVSKILNGPCVQNIFNFGATCYSDDKAAVVTFYINLKVMQT